jgi:hypothetical protein
MWDLWWTKLHRGRFYPNTSVSVAKDSTHWSTYMPSAVVVTIGQILGDVLLRPSLTQTHETENSV